MPSRPLLAIIHLDALTRNLMIVRQHTPHSKVMAVIKANGYGHGLMNAAQALVSADGFALLNIEDAIALRDEGYSHPILLLEGLFQSKDLALADRYRLDLVVHRADQIDILERSPSIQPLRVFLKINTGMNRLGFTQNIAQIFARLTACPAVSEIVLMTHFATADDAHGIHTQLLTFHTHTQSLSATCSLANSATILRRPEAAGGWVRPGIMLYGSSPFADQTAASLQLHPAMTLRSEIIATQNVSVGQGIGYGRDFVAPHAMRIGMVACGYADGYPRHAPTGTPASVSGALTRTIGRVSMDMLCVDLSALPEADIGSPVELWGKQIPVDQVAALSGTIGYELLTALTARVPLHPVHG